MGTSTDMAGDFNYGTVSFAVARGAVKARFAGGVIRGTFTEGPTCVGAGRFIARPR